MKDRTLAGQPDTVPHREMLPITLEEQLICFADKFFSKTHLDEEKSEMCIRDREAFYSFTVLIPARQTVWKFFC